MGFRRWLPVSDDYDPLKGKYAETVHAFTKPGHYIVQVERSNEHGYKATAHLHVEIINE
jgi:hypothetical protein